MENREFDYNVAKKNGNVFSGNVYIEFGAEIGSNNRFSNNCTISADCIIGDNNIFEVGVSIGSPSRERIMGTSIEKSISSSPKVVIGNNNLFEDWVSVQLALEGTTKIYDNVCVGAFSHVAHDSVLHSNVITASHCSIGGYSIMHKSANLGMGVRVHQRTVIGALAMIGMGGIVVNHIAPAATVVGVPTRFLCINRLGLERAGFTESEILSIERWLRQDAIVEYLPEGILLQIDEFYESLKLWRREKPVIPMDKR